MFSVLLRSAGRRRRLKYRTNVRPNYARVDKQSERTIISTKQLAGMIDELT